MLTYLLALAVGLGSLGLYATTFAVPEIARKNDLIWSGVGLFYALVLWVCAGRITGGVLLGQLASVALIGWFGWQTMELRWGATPESERVNAATVARVRDRVSGLVTQVQNLSTSVATNSDEASIDPVAMKEPPLTRADFGNPPKIPQPEAAKPTLTSFSNPDAGNPLGGLISAAKSVLEGWTKPKNDELNSKAKNKAVYVRKSFQDEGTLSTTISESETVAETRLPETPIVKPSFQSVTDGLVSDATPSAVPPEVAEVFETVESKVVEVMDEFGDTIDTVKSD